MPERDPLPPEDVVRDAISRTSFMLEHRSALRSLLHGRLFKRVPGSTQAPHGKEWRNVVEHCVEVARALDALADMLGMADDEREAIVNVGFVHDWNKRMTKDPAAFTPEEKVEAQAYSEDFLKEHDPDGHLLNATEPAGLERLEGTDAALAEHCVHLIDLSSMPEGLVPPEKRIEDIKRRRAIEGIDHDSEYPDFWKRKGAVALEEERKILAMLRARGVTIADGARLCDVLNERLRR